MAKKVLKHFPIIPRLRRMYKSPNLLNLMHWHHANRSQDGLVHHVVNFKAWAHIENSWPNFASDPRNVRLGFALDGMNPLRNQSIAWSTWLMIILNYNLPPWLTFKKLFLMFSLLIPGKKSKKNNKIDVYMAPLLEELYELWKGVVAWDVRKPEGHCMFTLQPILTWSIHDLLAYGLLYGQVNKGYKGCPACGLNTCSHSKKLGKIIYGCHRKWL